MSQELLKKFRDAGQGSRSQKEIARRAENQLRRNEMLGQKPNKALQNIMGEYVKESGDQLSSKRRDAITGASWMVGGPLLKGGVKVFQAGRAALAGLPRGITKVRGGFKVGGKTYKTIGGAKGAVTKAGKKPPPPPKTTAASKPPVDKATAARKAREAQGRSSAGGSADDAVAAGASKAAARAASKKGAARAASKKGAGSGRKKPPVSDRKTPSGGKKPGKLKAAVVPVATGLTAIAATRGSKPESTTRPNSTIADGKRKPKPPTTANISTKPIRKPVSGTGRGNMAGKNMGSESVSEYFGDMQGRNTKVRLPLGMGTIAVDSTDEGMAFEEFDQKKGGRLNKTVRRRMGGKVRGYGKAMRGY